ncbi:hypothetical protein [Eikenella corrodens]|uniref:Uncharacterized protein n=1 Tax=Eikenella corrodens ATCC 23834 TaxID=546274 RepID=C0DVL0_EIKCO|nr:hypothetical protein [Eikenella corrodens]EEG23884.1 hypothetical protein EIKCOROL_01399 [Eikenella corrodens ATCC 23834]
MRKFSGSLPCSGRVCKFIGVRNWNGENEAVGYSLYAELGFKMER